MNQNIEQIVKNGKKKKIVISSIVAVLLSMSLIALGPTFSGATKQQQIPSFSPPPGNFYYAGAYTGNGVYSAGFHEIQFTDEAESCNFQGCPSGSAPIFSTWESISFTLSNGTDFWAQVGWSVTNSQTKAVELFQIWNLNTLHRVSAWQSSQVLTFGSTYNFGMAWSTVISGSPKSGYYYALQIVSYVNGASVHTWTGQPMSSPPVMCTTTTACEPQILTEEQPTQWMTNANMQSWKYLVGSTWSTVPYAYAYNTNSYQYLAGHIQINVIPPGNEQVGWAYTKLTTGTQIW